MNPSLIAAKYFLNVCKYQRSDVFLYVSVGALTDLFNVVVWLNMDFRVFPAFTFAPSAAAPPLSPPPPICQFASPYPRRLSHDVILIIAPWSRARQPPLWGGGACWSWRAQHELAALFSMRAVGLINSTGKEEALHWRYISILHVYEWGGGALISNAAAAAVSHTHHSLIPVWTNSARLLDILL